MTDAQRNAELSVLGRELHDALIHRGTISPLTSRGLELTIDDAYRIQSHMLSHRLAEGIRIVGKKIGATSEPVQRAVGIDQPDFGILLEDCAYSSGATIPFERLIQPRAEGEIAFFLKERLQGPGITPEMVIAATEYVSTCIEIVDSRVRDWQIRIVDTIADNASCGVFILGAERIALEGIDLAACEMNMFINDVAAAHGKGSASLGHPANAVAWLANTLGTLGTALEPGEPILSGSLGQLVDVREDDVVRLAIERIGECEARFV